MRHTSVLLLAVLLGVLGSQPTLANENNNNQGQNEEVAPRDVCILGGGIGGMAAAVFLKDKGYNPLVVEKEDILGGSCTTVTFPVANSSLPNWVDIGVISFANTTFFTQSGWGGWTVDSVAFFERFVEKLIPVPVPATITVFDVDYTTGQQVQPAPINGTEFELRLGAYLEFLAANPWLTTLVSKPDPFPSDLLVPFDQWLMTNDYTVLIPIFRELIGGGTTNYSAITAFEALRMATNIIGILNIVGSGPAQFSVEGGCIKLYDGMQAYLGAENVLTSVDIALAVRPSHNVGGFNLPSTLIGTRKQHGHEKPFVQTCEKLVLAFPPLLEELTFLQLDSQEEALFSAVRAYNYYVTTGEVAGPAAAADFVVDNINPNRLFELAEQPTFVYMFRGFTYGPAVVGMSSANPISAPQMLDIAQVQLDRTPDSILNSVTLALPGYKHLYSPYFLASEMAKSPTAYTRLDNLQGHRNTYYSSSLLSVANHVAIINQVDGFIATHFPTKA